MEFDRGITKYDIMPIPPVELHTERFEAGPISIGVEYRLLDDLITALHTNREMYDKKVALQQAEDRGVSLHVFGRTGDDNVEYLRFDCFDEDPHYHYVSYAKGTNEMVHVDPVAVGDPLAWALECIRTRLPQMLERAGAGELAQRVDTQLLETIIPQVAGAAYRARFQHDDEAIHREATSTSPPRAQTGQDS